MAVVKRTSNLKTQYGLMAKTTFAKLADESVLKKRKDAFEKGIATTYWVQTFIDRGGVRSRPNEYLLTDLV